jgi:hypothetical protein
MSKFKFIFECYCFLEVTASMDIETKSNHMLDEEVGTSACIYINHIKLQD